MLALSVDNLDACNGAFDKLTLAEVEQWTATTKPLQFPKAFT